MVVLAEDSVGRVEKAAPVPDLELVPARAVERAAGAVAVDACAVRAHEFWKARV